MRTSLALIALFAATAPLAAQGQVDTTTKRPPAPATTGYGAWFGSIPDMDNSFGGILLSGVTIGSPAEKAGLKAGDMILKIGGAEMADLQAMTTLLRAKRPGDTVQVVFLRAREQKNVAVILGTRPGS